jgi:hypothetical protein
MKVGTSMGLVVAVATVVVTACVAYVVYSAARWTWSDHG